jgi:hypothetical protein
MKVIGHSNFDLDNVSEVLVCENIKQSYADILVKALNDRSGENATYYYSVVPDDHKLYRWEP